MSVIDDYTPGGYPNRTLCDVLKDMRSLFKVSNFSMLPALIEEVQIMGNRMEAALEDQKDFREIREQMKKAREELKKLKSELKLLNHIKEIK